MARIRTIKPEFWTDSTIVQLPFEARLLFIGMWNFADDEGFLPFEPEQIRLQILPADEVDGELLIDILIAAGLVDVFVFNGREVLRIIGFCKHQKISHPTKSQLIPENSGGLQSFPEGSYKKKNIPAAERRAIAIKYGCEPGGQSDCECYYCGAPGKIWWPKTSKGKPGYWVGFSHAIDHFIPESESGSTEALNFVLACHFCNKSKGTKDGISVILQRIPENSGGLQSFPEGSSVNGKEGNGKEGNGKGSNCASGEPPASGQVKAGQVFFDELVAAWNLLPGGIAPQIKTPAASTNTKAWDNGWRKPEVREWQKQPAAIIDRVTSATYCHGKQWFTFAWLFKREKDGTEFNLCKLMDGRYSPPQPKSLMDNPEIQAWLNQ